MSISETIASLPEWLQLVAVVAMVVAAATLRWMSQRNGRGPARRIDLRPLEAEVAALGKSVRGNSDRLRAVERRQATTEETNVRQSETMRGLSEDIRAILEYVTNGASSGNRPDDGGPKSG
jgi:hypothetical protein